MKKLMIAVLTAAIFLVSCSDYIKPDLDYSGGERIDENDFESISLAVAQNDKKNEKPKYPLVFDENGDQVVYWVSGGSVWHNSRDCSALSKSGNIFFGTKDDATENGIERVCKICGQSETTDNSNK